jgi:Trypsin
MWPLILVLAGCLSLAVWICGEVALAQAPPRRATVNYDNKGGLKITRRLPQRLVPNLDRRGYERAARSRDRFTRYVQKKTEPAPPQDAGTWSASFFDKDLGCTVTLIGPRVLLTAAHCVGDGAEVLIEDDSGVLFKGVCRRSSDWDFVRNFTADFALCFSEVAVSEDAGILFERLNVDGVWLAGTNRVMLAGFGCTADHGAGEEVHSGPATVFYIGPFIRRGTFVYAGQRWYNNQLATLMQSSTDGVLCSGDSGGPTVYLFDKDQVDGRRAIVGVNSASSREEGLSYIAGTASAGFRLFLADWLERHPEARICGLGRPQDREIDTLCHQ